ncbi:MAG: class IV adenylate cyclase, partial [Candidatus Heimdallarchaeota archaeon]
PARDFAQTDEAFRIREEGTEVLLTYKGPKFDKKSKTRKEIEIKIPNTEQMFELLNSLGFRKVHVVSKERKIYVLNDIHWSLDLVDSLGSFIELEKIVSTKDEVDSALIAIFEAVESLGLKPKDTIRKSYMELLLEKK